MPGQNARAGVKAIKMINEILRKDLETTILKMNEKFDLEGFMGKSIHDITSSFFNDFGYGLEHATAVREMEEYGISTYHHLLGTCVLSWLGYSFLKKQDYAFANEVEAPIFMLAAIYHDIGKRRVRESVLNKTKGMTPDEFREIQEHTKEGYSMIDGLFEGKKVPTAFIKAAARYHHENLNGNGYEGLMDPAKFTEQLQIIAAADVFHATHLRGGYQPMISANDLAHYLEFVSTDYKENTQRCDYLKAKLGGLKKEDGSPLFKNLEAGKYSGKMVWPFIALLQDYARDKAAYRADKDDMGMGE